MRERIIRRNIIITTLSLIIFYIVAVFINTGTNRRTIQSNLINISNIIVKQLQDDPSNYEKIINYYSLTDEWVQVIIASNSGDIIYDSTNDINYSYYNLKISDKVSIEGELHSRTYKKTLDNGEIEIKTAHELVVTNLEIIND